MDQFRQPAKVRMTIISNLNFIRNFIEYFISSYKHKKKVLKIKMFKSFNIKLEVKKEQTHILIF